MFSLSLFFSFLLIFFCIQFMFHHKSTLSKFNEHKTCPSFSSLILYHFLIIYSYLSFHFFSIKFVTFKVLDFIWKNIDSYFYIFFQSLSSTQQSIHIHLRSFLNLWFYFNFLNIIVDIFYTLRAFFQTVNVPF